MTARHRAGSHYSRSRTPLAGTGPTGPDGPQKCFQGVSGEMTSSLGEQLLVHIHRIFEETGQSRLQSVELAKALQAIDTAPWADWEGDGTRRLARLLKPYEIESRTMRFGTHTHKAYERSYFADAFARYLPAHTVSTTQDSSPSAKSNADPLRSRSTLRDTISRFRGR